MSNRMLSRDAIKLVFKYMKRANESGEYAGLFSNTEYPTPEELFRAGARIYDQQVLSGYIVEYLDEAHGRGTFDADAVRERIERDYLKAWSEQEKNYRNDAPRLYDDDFVENMFKAISAEINVGGYRSDNAAGTGRGRGSGLPARKGSRPGNGDSLSQREFDKRWSSGSEEPNHEILDFVIQQQSSKPTSKPKSQSGFAAPDDPVPARRETGAAGERSSFGKDKDRRQGIFPGVSAESVGGPRATSVFGPLRNAQAPIRRPTRRESHDEKHRNALVEALRRGAASPYYRTGPSTGPF